MLLAQITAPYFCAGIVLRRNPVTLGYQCAEYAPILHFMRGWTAARIKLYCDRKGWNVQRVGRVGG